MFYLALWHIYGCKFETRWDCLRLLSTWLLSHQCIMFHSCCYIFGSMCWKLLTWSFLLLIFNKMLRGCLVCDFKQSFSVFKQHFMYFNALFHLHVFPQIFSNNSFQFLNTCTTQTLSCFNLFIELLNLCTFLLELCSITNPCSIKTPLLSWL